jgi:hypothetical protein
MPTLDDIPILQRVTPAGDDLIPISDPNGTGGSQVRAIALNQINGLSAADVTTFATAASSVTANRFTFLVTGATTTTVNIPAPSGVLREIFVSNGGSGNATITAATATIRTAAAPTAATTVTLAAGGYQHYMSDGTNWFRVH